METQAKKKLLQFKLRSLEEQQERLHSLIDERISKILDAGRDWLTDRAEEGENLSFPALSQMMDFALMFLCEKCSEMKDEILTSSSATNETSIKEVVTSSRQSRFSADREIEKPVVPGDRLEAVMARLSKLETDMGDMSIKHTQTIDRWEKQSTLVQNHLDEFRQKQEDFVTQRDRQIENLRDELQNMRDTQENMTRIYTLDKAESTERLEQLKQQSHKDSDLAQSYIQETRDQMQELKKRIETQSRDITKLKETVDSISQEKKAASEMMSITPRPVIAFTAALTGDVQPVIGKTITDYGTVTGSSAHSFCKDTGIFTAPVKGLYAVCVKLWQRGKDEGRIVIKIIQTKKSGIRQGTQVARWAGTNKTYSGDFELSVTELEEGDTLHVEVHSVKGNLKLNDGTTFSCFFIV